MSRPDPRCSRPDRRLPTPGAASRPESGPVLHDRRPGDRWRPLAGHSHGWLALGSSLCLLMALGSALPARAGSITAESIWDRSRARAMAMQQLPQGARVTQVSCFDIGMAGNTWRYRCTVTYDMQPPVSPQP